MNAADKTQWQYTFNEAHTMHPWSGISTGALSC
jgi:hypothetical protein